MGRYGTELPATDGGGRGSDDPGGGDWHGDRGDTPDGTSPIVVVLGISMTEGHRILTPVQYAYTVGFVQRLGDFGNIVATSDLRIRRFGDFWALKLKGGFLKRINLRIYFAYVKEKNEVVVFWFSVKWSFW